MLTKEENDYISKINPKKRISILPFDPKSKQTGDMIVRKIKEKLPNMRVLFMGAAAFGIAGQNDIDIYVLSNSRYFEEYIPIFENLFGKPKHIRKTFVEWDFYEDGHSVELYLTEPPERQIKVYEILKSNQKLLKEYEDLKLSYDGKSYKDYQRAKYEFYSRILNNE